MHPDAVGVAAEGLPMGARRSSAAVPLEQPALARLGGPEHFRAKSAWGARGERGACGERARRSLTLDWQEVMTRMNGRDEWAKFVNGRDE
eukprot:4895984-Prymnesium_polylepis.1